MNLLIRRFVSYSTATLAYLCLTSPARADLVVTDRNQFLAQVASGYYLEGFDTLSVQLYTTPLNFSGNGFSYTASAGDGLYPGAPNGNVDLSIDNALEPLDIVFAGAPVTAVGGYLFGNDIAGNFILGNITIDLNDGTKVTVQNAMLNSFLGILTDNPIASLRIYSDEFIVGDDVLPNDIWPATDDFIVGTAVPEPSSFVLVISTGIPLVLIYLHLRRRLR